MFRPREVVTKYNTGCQRGFTIIETLVAVAILTLAITGPISVVTASLSSSAFSRETLTASLLAQEAVEFMRYDRDKTTTWALFTAKSAGTCLSGNPCTINSAAASAGDGQDAYVNCGSVAACTPLYYNSTTGVYNQASGAGFAASPYRRYVSVALTGPASNILNVTVNVAWVPKAFGVTRTLVSRDFVFQLK